MLHISSGNFLGSELHCCKDLCDRCTNSNDRCMGWRGRSGERVLGACEGVWQIVHHFVVHWERVSGIGDVCGRRFVAAGDQFDEKLFNL